MAVRYSDENNGLFIPIDKLPEAYNIVMGLFYPTIPGTIDSHYNGTFQFNKVLDMIADAWLAGKRLQVS